MSSIGANVGGHETGALKILKTGSGRELAFLSQEHPAVVRVLPRCYPEDIRTAVQAATAEITAILNEIVADTQAGHSRQPTHQEVAEGFLLRLRPIFQAKLDAGAMKKRFCTDSVLDCINCSTQYAYAGLKEVPRIEWWRHPHMAAPFGSAMITAPVVSYWGDVKPIAALDAATDDTADQKGVFTTIHNELKSGAGADEMWTQFLSSYEERRSGATYSTKHMFVQCEVLQYGGKLLNPPQLAVLMLKSQARDSLLAEMNLSSNATADKVPDGEFLTGYKCGDMSNLASKMVLKAFNMGSSGNVGTGLDMGRGKKSSGSDVTYRAEFLPVPSLVPRDEATVCAQWIEWDDLLNVVTRKEMWAMAAEACSPVAVAFGGRGELENLPPELRVEAENILVDFPIGGASLTYDELRARKQAAMASGPDEMVYGAIPGAVAPPAGAAPLTSGELPGAGATAAGALPGAAPAGTLPGIGETTPGVGTGLPGTAPVTTPGDPDVVDAESTPVETGPEITGVATGAEGADLLAAALGTTPGAGADQTPAS